MLPPVFLSLRLCLAGLRIRWLDSIAGVAESFSKCAFASILWWPLSPVRRNVNQIIRLCLPKISSGRQKVLKEGAERVGIGFELAIQSSVVALNAPKKSTNLQ